MVIQFTDEQFECFRKYTVENYVLELSMKIDSAFPYLKKTLGDECFKQAISGGVIKAEKIGFSERGPVQLYVSLLIVFGSGFETDPQYAWFSKVMDENKSLPQLEQADFLFEKVRCYLDEIGGESERHLLNCASKLLHLDFEKVNIRHENYINDIHELLIKLHPQKYLSTPKDDITILIQQGIIKANNIYGFDNTNHVALIVLFMFFMGHQFDQDPFYQWIDQSKFLQYRHNSQLLANKFESRAKIWLQAALQNHANRLNTQI
ncbi:hypothetical protein [Serratia silvae]|uniref:Uncharacterized protein n=1 Tax=Serratia silvae TaxID=2824122 RepID=A0ABT0KBX6_9GAMM|nr:hypothetical protein [Serratia silvae]MCL1029417.1 hypothetical protein [Serratia silvae]